MDYRSYLKRILAQKISRNPSYSIRAFAKHLSIHHSMLAAVLKKQKRLSLERASLIADRMGLNSQESEFFCLLVELDHVKNPDRKSWIVSRLNEFRQSDPVYEVSVDYFEVITAWYHLPILQMVGEPCFSMDSTAIADRLGIHPIEAETALDRLQRLSFIERDSKSGSYRKTHSAVQFHSPDFNSNLQKFHRYMLEKAVESISRQSPEERLIQTQTIAFDQRQIKEVDVLTDQYFERVVQLSLTGEKRDQIYHLGTVFFNLTPFEGGKIK